MARGRIFKITKAQAEGYEVLDPPKSRKRARSNPGVTAIMGITNGRGAAKRSARKLRRRGAITGLKSVRTQKRVGGIDCLGHAPPKHVRHGSTKRSDYALPQCFRFPVRTRGKATKAKVRRALGYYGKSKHLYSTTVRREIEHGIARAAFEAGITSPVAMRYRKKFALANETQRGESPMFVVHTHKRRPRKATRKSARKLKFGSPAWQKKYNPLFGGKKSGRKSSKRVRRLSPARAFVLYPSGSKVGASATPNKKRKARKSTAKHPKFGTHAYYVWLGKRAHRAKGRKAAAKPRKRVARKSAAKKYRVISGVRMVGVGRAKGKKRGLSVFMRNRKHAAANKRRHVAKYSRAWHHKMTHAVANAYRYARRNEAGEEPDWSEPREEASEWTGTQADARKEAKVAAAAAAEGIAVGMFATQADYDTWFNQMWKSKTFRKFYNAHRRAGTAKPRKATMAKRKARKSAARKPRKARKARKGTRKLKFGSPAWRKKYARKIAAGRRKAKKARKSGTRKPARRTTARKAARRTRRSPTRRRSAPRRKLKFGGKAWRKKYARKIAAGRRKAKRTRRHARRNFGFIPNQLISRVKALAVPGLVALGGYAVHRFATTLVSGVIGSSVGTYADALSGLAVIAAGVWAVNKFLPAHAMPATMGMAVSLGALLVKTFMPSVAAKLGMGSIPGANQRVRYGMMGPQFMQAAAGPQFLQAAAGSQFMQAAADYYQPTSGIGEYVSDGSLRTSSSVARGFRRSSTSIFLPSILPAARTTNAARFPANNEWGHSMPASRTSEAAG